MSVSRLFIYSVIFCGVALPSFAQNINPGPKKIYKEDEIAIVKISMDPAAKEWMLAEENKWSDTYQAANFSFKNSDIDTTLAIDVGIRLRGNTSRNHPKKSFKIKFKEFGGEKFFDLKKFNLKAEVNDPTLLREMMALRAFRDFEVPAARSHLVELYINNEYMGLYLNVEQIDDEFVQRRFDYDGGNIYKCQWSGGKGPNLENDGQIHDNGRYELETNKEINDRSKLDNFVEVLNTTPSSSLATELEKVFNVDRYIRYLAVEALVGHWDGYSYNKNNFYLYENDTTGLVEFIVYDVDNTFGIDWVERDWGTRDILDWVRHGGDPRPLSHKILEVSAYYERYRRYIDELLKTAFSTSYYYPQFDSYEVMLADAIGRDDYYPLSFGFTVADFHSNFDDGLSAYWHLPYGLKQYVAARTSSARSQLGIITSLDPYKDSALSVYPNPSIDGRIYLKSGSRVSKPIIFDNRGRIQQFDWSRLSGDLVEIRHNLPQGIYLIKSSAGSRTIVVN